MAYYTWCVDTFVFYHLLPILIMTGLWIALAFVVWYAAALALSENYADRKPGRQWLFFISFIFSPVLALLVVYLFRKDQK